MRNFLVLSAYLLICLCAYLFITPSVQAASLKFDQSVISVSVGSTFNLGVIVDAGSDQITSADMWILYDATLLEAQSASSSAFFPAVTSNISAGKVYVAGLVTDPGTYKTGSGTVAVITFKGLKNGQATLNYDCRTDVSNSSKVIKNAVDPTNVIICTSNGTSVVTIGTGAVTVSPTTAAAVPTSVYAQQTNPTALPKSGIADVMPKLFIAGSLFVVVGVVMRALLLL